MYVTGRQCGKGSGRGEIVRVVEEERKKAEQNRRERRKTRRRKPRRTQTKRNPPVANKRKCKNRTQQEKVRETIGERSRVEKQCRPFVSVAVYPSPLLNSVARHPLFVLPFLPFSSEFFALYCTCETTSLALARASTICWHSFLRRTV